MKINFDKRHPLEPILIKLILGWHFKPRCYWHGLPSGCDDPSLTEGPMENNHLPQYWIFQAQRSTEKGLDCSLLRETLAKIKETYNLWYSGYQQSYLASGIMWSMLWLSPVITSILLTNESEKEHLDCSVVDLKIMTMEFGLRATECLLEWLHTALSHCFSQGLELCQDLRTLYRWDECCSPFSKFTSQTELLFIHNQGNNRYHLGRIFGNFLTYFPQYI